MDDDEAVAAHAARMAARESKRIAAERRLMATNENANDDHAQGLCLQNYDKGRHQRGLKCL
jgi:hypothetical protein